MTIVPFLVVAAVAGTVSLLVRDQRGWSTLIALVGLALMSATAAAIGSAATIQVGGTMLAGSEWLRLYALLGSLVGLLLVAIDVSAVHEPDVPGVIVLGLGAAVLGLAIPDTGVAVVAATAGGLAGILVAAPIGAAARAAFVGIRELRALVVAGSLAIVATAWLARPLEDLGGAPAAFGLAYLAFAIAVAIRFGAIPFHLWAARVADAAPGVALPLLMAWGPAAFAAVALTWIDRSVAPLALPLDTERGLIASVGAVGVVLGILAAWIQDDLEHIVGYTIAADAGFAVLSLAILGPEAWEPARTWLLIFVVGRSAFAAWAVAIHGGFGTRRLPELGGWVRRAPLLGVALVVIAIAAIGSPGLTIWHTRAAIAALALPDPFATLVTIAPLASIAIYGRIVWIGLQAPSPVVREGRGDRPGWPTGVPRRPMVGVGPLERGFERAGHAATGALDVIWVLPAAARQNRMPLASTAVLALAALALAVSAGGLGVPEAARAVPVIMRADPGDGTGAGPEGPVHGAAPSGQPIPSGEPVASEG
ncbi:MAG TPA: proton-conducting transporter membrane subunit [Patescibacteria group bacterium]|nr:proton-conducting transporter membrane subunit [Patescibacteria group bacterium]